MNAGIKVFAGVLLGASLVLAGCGAAQTAEQAAYEATCKTQQADHKRHLAMRNYQPPELVVYLWPGDEERASIDARPTLLSEADFIARLRDGKARQLLLTGSAGVGKSTFARSLAAQLCGDMPVASVDLAWGLTATDPDPVLTAVAKAIGVAPGADPGAALQTQIGSQDVVLLLDAFDEVPQEHRLAVAGKVKALAARLPKARIVVLSRPPLFGSTVSAFGGFDARLGLPSSDCAKIDWHVMSRRKATWEKEKFRTFLKHWKLGRKITTGQGCRYTYMPTYRDLDIVWELAQPSGDKVLAADFATGFKGARATLLEHHLKRSLLRAFESTSYRPAQAMPVLDAMVAAAGGLLSKRRTFGQRDCTKAFADAKVGGGGAIQPGAFCKKMLAADLFASQANRRHFASRTSAEYFVARWLASRLTTPQGPKCDALAGHRSLLESSEVASILIGLRPGGMCLAQVIQQLCTGDMPAAHVVGTLRRGLPGGEHRIEYLGHASEQIPKSAPGGACVDRVLTAASSE